ncbi:MAG TPA: D-alanyl-D-alanine carboxypeptidase [Firmicutes bacterium]|nr:D-alanyl-D-alanine carboxypeptidase [Bacillota bacterium]
MFISCRRIAITGAIICMMAIAMIVLLVHTQGFQSVSSRYRYADDYQEVVYVPDYASGPYITAGAAILVERNTGTVLYARNEHVRRPPASTTKIMTALLAIERGDLDSIVTVSKRAAGIEGSSLWLRPGEKIRLYDLLKGVMLRSGNDGCVAIAEHIAGSQEAFVEMMNQKARQLGARNTHFMNPHGLHHPNHYSSAFDLALMACYGLRYPEFAEIVRTREAMIESEGKEGAIKRQLANTNALLWSFEGADGVKTGTTSAAGYCLVASATRDGCQYVSVVLHSDARWSDSARLLDYAFKEFHLATLAKKGQPLTRIPVRGGLEGEVPVVPLRDLQMVVRKRDLGAIKLKIMAEEPVKAPVKAGERLGSLVVYFDDQSIASVDLIAERSVGRRRIWNLWLERLSWRNRLKNQPEGRNAANCGV